jgi:hypothetical protein
LPTFEAQRAHVLSSVYQKLATLRDIVGQPAVRAIERELDERCFMLGFLDRQITAQNRGPADGLAKLLDFFDAAIEPIVLPARKGPPITKAAIDNRFNTKLQASLDFVFSHYVSEGVQELNRDKLTPFASSITIQLPMLWRNSGNRMRHGNSSLASRSIFTRKQRRSMTRTSSTRLSTWAR